MNDGDWRRCWIGRIVVRIVVVEHTACRSGVNKCVRCVTGRRIHCIVHIVTVLVNGGR